MSHFAEQKPHNSLARNSETAGSPLRKEIGGTPVRHGEMFIRERRSGLRVAGFS